MKIKNYLLAGLAALSMAGCSDDELNPNGPQIAEKDGRVYMKVSIANPKSTGTKALSDDPNEFVDGTDKENEVKEIIFAFYNDNGNFVGTSTMKYSDNPNGDLEFGDTNIDNTSTNNVETILTMVVPVDVNAGNAMPSQVVAYVNPIKQDHSAADNLEAFSKLTRNSTQYQSSNGFVMNNSVYYTGTTQGGAKPNVAVNIAAALKPTKEEAAKVGDDDAIVIHVERICAKVQVTKSATGLDFNQGTSVGDVLANETTINFHPTGWALNVTENNTYLLKQFRVDKDAASATFNEMNDRFSKNQNDWNSAGLFRSYWCTSLGYSHNDYPKVASDAITNEGELPVHYIKYNDAKNKWEDNVYCLEHTVRSVGASLAAYTSVIVAGYYTLGENNAAGTFYTFGEDNNKKPYVYKHNATDLPELIEAMAKSTMTIYKKDGDTYPALTTGAELANVFEVVRPKNLTDKPSRYVYLQLKSDIAPNTYFYEKDGVQTDISTETTAINSSLLTGAPATKFEEGAVYYNIPIEQFGKNDHGEAIFGTYGVVRNHYYKIDITGISGLGTAIGNKEDPIIPPTEEVRYYVKTKMNVLAWRVASQQVELGK